MNIGQIIGKTEGPNEYCLEVKVKLNNELFDIGCVLINEENNLMVLEIKENQP